MKIEMDKIISLSDLQNDITDICKKVEQKQELFVFQDNKPTYIFMTIENYINLSNEIVTLDDKLEDQEDDTIEVLLNKIGKKVFVDYYYIFKEDINPEEKLPKDFTINSRRSRSSSARQIFKNNLEMEALRNIIESTRLNEDTLDTAKTILEKEETGLSIVESDYDIEELELKIGRMARILITKFLKDEIITDKEIKLMQDENYSKKIFNLNFAILKKIDRSLDFEDQKRDDRGYNRYYNNAISVGNNEYIMCSQWVENLHKSNLERWIESKLMEIIIIRIEKLETDVEFIIPKLLVEYWPYVSNTSRKVLGKKFVEEVRKNSVSGVVELPNIRRKSSQVYKKVNI